MVPMKLDSLRPHADTCPFVWEGKAVDDQEPANEIWPTTSFDPPHLTQDKGLQKPVREIQKCLPLPLP